MFFQTIVPQEDALPGAVIAVQTFGDFLGFNPHCHVLCTDGGFYGKGMFRVAPWFIPKNLEKLFRYKVFKMLLSRFSCNCHPFRKDMAPDLPSPPLNALPSSI